MKTKNAWHWVPSLYFAQGLPYVIVMTLSVIMFKRLGISNTEIALYTSWLYLPWVIKPLWSPLVDIIKTKRWWVISMQIFIGGALAGIALTLPGPHAFQYTLAYMWLLAFSSATHDIATDGFYMLGLNTQQQAFFVGIRNTAYRIAILTGQGLIVMLAGWLEEYYSTSLPSNIAISQAWSSTFWILCISFLFLFLYHQFLLPHPETKLNPSTQKSNISFFDVFRTFFQKQEILTALLFILLFRFAEAQLVKIASPFLLDSSEKGGLGLSTLEVGSIYGVIGLIALTVGGIIGGILISKKGLTHCLWGMALSINLPNVVYLYLAFFLPTHKTLISSLIAIEQFGYGFGFTALTFFMIHFCRGPYQTAHYALCTGFMALGMMIPGAISGWIQELFGYQIFFVWIMICTLPSFIATKLIQRKLKNI